MGYLVVTAVLVVSLRPARRHVRPGADVQRRASRSSRSSRSCSRRPGCTAPPAALWLIVMRVLQGVGGALLMANSSAIITDAFPADQRGLALGLNMVAGIAGSFIGLVIGGVLAPIDWRLVFLVSVPFGLFGTVWAYLKLRDTRARAATHAWTGGATSPSRVGPDRGAGRRSPTASSRTAAHTMGWTNPWVLAALIGGCAAAGGLLRDRDAGSRDPMFQLDLFRIRAFTVGNLASLLAGARPRRPEFILIIWLQGIWLPLHGYSFESHAAVGRHLHAADDGRLPGRRAASRAGCPTGSAPAASPPAGMLVAARASCGCCSLPVDFTYWQFAAALLLNGLGMGLFAAPNRAGHHERPARPPARRRGRHEHDVPERRRWCSRSASSSR